jgi:hypothetical protein
MVQSILVMVTPLNDDQPVFTSATSYLVPENVTAVGTVTATDSDLPAQTVTFSITGGTDAAQFSVTSDSSHGGRRARPGDLPECDRHRGRGRKQRGAGASEP